MAQCLLVGNKDNSSTSDHLSWIAGLQFLDRKPNVYPVETFYTLSGRSSA